MGCRSGSTICSNQLDALIQFPKPFSNSWLGGLPPILKLESHLPHPACVKFLKILEKEDGKNIHTNVLKETVALGHCGWGCGKGVGITDDFISQVFKRMQDYGSPLLQIVVKHLFTPLILQFSSISLVLPNF